MQVVRVRPGHILTQAWGWGLDFVLHRGHLRQFSDPAARWQGFSISLGLSFLISEMGM